MRRIWVLSLLLFFSLNCHAQLEVKEDSFKEVAGFINLNENPDYQLDDNDQPFAVIKIKTENINDKQRRQLHFEGDLRTYFLCEYKIGEVWLYISYYATFLKISHPDFSSTEFYFPFDLQPKKGYELTLANKTQNAQTPSKPDFNYLIIKTDQQNARIFIDDKLVGNGEVSKAFKIGETHQWAIECDLYHTESGTATIVEDNPVIIIKDLRPAYGFIYVTSSPERGATVYIDNKKVGVTPYKSDKLASGQHQVSVTKERFSDAEKTVTVTDGNTTDVDLNMNSLTAHQSQPASSRNTYQSGFITFDVAMDSYNKFSYGFSIGIHYSNNISYYFSYSGKNMLKETKTNYSCGNDFLVNGYYPSYTGNTVYQAMSMIIGMVVRDSKPLSYRFGLGLGNHYVYYEATASDYNGKHYYVKNTDLGYTSLDVSAGIQYYLRGVLISVDAITTSFKCYSVKLGVGLGI